MRNLKASLICGLLAGSLAALLFARGVFAPVEMMVFGAAQNAAIWPQWAGALLLATGLAWAMLDIPQTALRAIVAAIALGETAILALVLRFFGIAWPPFSALFAGLLGIGFGVVCAWTARRRRLRARRRFGRCACLFPRRRQPGLVLRRGRSDRMPSLRCQRRRRNR